MIKYSSEGDYFRSLDGDPKLNFTGFDISSDNVNINAELNKYDNGDKEMVVNYYYDQIVLDNKADYKSLMELLVEAGKILGWNDEES